MWLQNHFTPDCLVRAPYPPENDITAPLRPTHTLLPGWTAGDSIIYALLFAVFENFVHFSTPFVLIGSNCGASKFRITLGSTIRHVGPKTRSNVSL